MRKWIMISLLIMMSMMLSSCQTYTITYTDDDPFVLEMKGDSLKILQLTDLHLTFGHDQRDRRTFHLIEALNNQDDYDLIVITGDMTMSPSAPALFRKLITFMETLKTPWTFIFGNHETDYHTYEDLIRVIPDDTSYLYFKVGPKLEEGGIGNFHFTITKDDQPVYRLYMLDSKAERNDYTEEEGEYDYLSTAQVNWFKDHAELDTVRNLVFMHIPLRQYIDAVDYDGFFLEDKVYAQGVDTGFFDAMVDTAKTTAVFVGHDHLNDFIFARESIFLVYGRATGFNGYGSLEKGGRHIEVYSDSSTIRTFVMRESVVLP